MNRSPSTVADEVDEDGTRPARAEVVAVGRVHELACAIVVAHLGALLNLRTRVGPPLPDPDFALARGRGQHDAALLLQRLAERRAPDTIRVGVTEVDLCLPVFTHVYGEAEVGGGVAVVSLHRLRGDDPRPAARGPLLYQRLARVACHEAGHALGLTHCGQSGCLMRFVGCLEALDDLELVFCAACGAELAARRALLAQGRSAF